MDGQGRRCTERNRLEFHHRHPYGLGGDHGLENIRLMCRAHNAYLAEHDYGTSVMAQYRGSGNRGMEAVTSAPP
jgi:HNH endonuclease